VTIEEVADEILSRVDVVSSEGKVIEEWRACCRESRKHEKEEEKLHLADDGPQLSRFGMS
jgi:hypothetical protein